MQLPCSFAADMDKCIDSLHSLSYATIDVSFVSVIAVSAHFEQHAIEVCSVGSNFYLWMGDQAIDMQLCTYKAAFRSCMHSFHYLPKDSA